MHYNLGNVVECVFWPIKTHSPVVCPAIGQFGVGFCKLS